MPQNKEVDAYIARSAEFAKPILTHLRALVHEACPEVNEVIKWGFPNFDYKGVMCNMGASNSIARSGSGSTASSTIPKEFFCQKIKAEAWGTSTGSRR